jgi:chromate transporter
MISIEQQYSDLNQEKKAFSLISIFWTFFRIGLFTLGGGLAMATVLRHELVLKRRWIEDDEFLERMAMATVVPGVIAVNVAYLQGRRLRGKAGATVAILGTVLPSFFVILFIAWVGLPYFSRPKVAAFFKGCAIAVAGQLAFAGLTFGKKLLRNWRNLIVCAVSVVPVIVFNVHPVWTIIIAVGLGYFICRTDEPPGRLNDRY